MRLTLTQRLYLLLLGLALVGCGVLWVGQQRILDLEDALSFRRAVRWAPAPEPPAAPPHDPPHDPPAAPAPTTPPAPPAPAVAAVPLLRVPSSAWSFRGGATPLTCFESVLWAATQGDTERLRTVLSCDPPAQAALAAAFARLPEETRRQHRTPEQLLATMVAVQVPEDATAYQLLGERATAGGETLLALRVERRGREATRQPEPSYFVFRCEADGWRLVVPPPIVGQIVRNLTGRTAPRPESTP